jgi:hypothetical protein
MRKDSLIQTMLDIKKLSRGHDSSPLMMERYYNQSGQYKNDDFYHVIQKTVDQIIPNDNLWHDDTELKIWLGAGVIYHITLFLKWEDVFLGTPLMHVSFGLPFGWTLGSSGDWTYSSTAGFFTGSGVQIRTFNITGSGCPCGYAICKWFVHNTSISATIRKDSYIIATRLS